MKQDILQKMAEDVILEDAEAVFESNEGESPELLKSYFLDIMDTNSYHTIKNYIAEQIDFAHIANLFKEGKRNG